MDSQDRDEVGHFSDCVEEGTRIDRMSRRKERRPGQIMKHGEGRDTRVFSTLGAKSQVAVAVAVQTLVFGFYAQITRAHGMTKAQLHCEHGKEKSKERLPS